VRKLSHWTHHIDRASKPPEFRMRSITGRAVNPDSGNFRLVGRRWKPPKGETFDLLAESQKDYKDSVLKGEPSAPFLPLYNQNAPKDHGPYFDIDDGELLRRRRFRPIRPRLRSTLYTIYPDALDLYLADLRASVDELERRNQKFYECGRELALVSVQVHEGHRNEDRRYIPRYHISKEKSLPENALDEDFSDEESLVEMIELEDLERKLQDEYLERKLDHDAAVRAD